MVYISFFAALILIAFLLFCYVNFGVTDMISDYYYKLKKISNFESNLFSITMFIVGMCMMICLLDTEQGLQQFAFGGGAGLILVSVAPNFKDTDVRTVHKAGAILSGMFCIGWCISVMWIPTLCISLLYALYILLCFLNNKVASIFRIDNTGVPMHWLYWAEIAAFIDTFITYWIIV